MRYNVSKSTDAAQWRDVLEKAMQSRVGTAIDVITGIQNQLISDHIVRDSKLKFHGTQDASGRAQIRMALSPDVSKTLHINAVRQLSEKTNMPKKFIDLLVGEGVWGADLIAHNLNEIMYHRAAEQSQKYLVRSVGDEARGILSDRYRRIDSRPLIDAFAQECEMLGAQPIEGYALDTTMRVRAILPHIFEPYPGEFIAFGLEWKNSDFGVGGHEVKLFMLRPVCLNGATRESLLRQIHTGARISDDYIYSSETYRLDTQLNMSRLRDIMRYALAPANIDAQVDSIRYAHEMKIDPKKAKAMLDARLTKSDAADVLEAYTSADIEMMPAGNSVYRLSNALSWVANLKAGDDAEKSLELQQFAGEIMPAVKLITTTEID